MEAPEYYYYCSTADKASAASAVGEHFVVDDLLDFSNADSVAGAGFFENAATNSADSSVVTVAAVDSCNSSFCCDNGGSNNSNSHHINGGFCLNSFFGGSKSFGSGECNLSGELCIPCDDLAELEWLSNFVEDSFSAKQPSLFIPAAAAYPSKPGSSSTSTPTSHGPLQSLDSSPVFLSEPSPLPSKSRSKRPRAIPCDWTTRLLHLTVSATTEPTPRASSSRQESGGTTCTSPGRPDVAPRRCLHCAAEKTPQWRTGPLGPKTLCNACGVRYKSGRLVPEYRPAASPTFVSTKHSNSHRKVIELRRQKDVQRVHPHPHPPPHHHPQFIIPSPIYGGGGNGGDHEYLIGGPRFRHMI